MSICSKLTSGLIATECGKMVASGTNRKVYLINYDDINRENSVVVDGILGNLELNDKAYLFESKRKSTLGEATFARGTYSGQYDHAVTIRAFVKNEDAHEFARLITEARLVAIVETNESGMGKYEVYGWDNGLTLSELPYTTDVTDGVVYSIKVASDDAAKEGQLPLFYWLGTSETTETALASLLV